MDDMRELVTVEQAQRFFLILAILAPLAGGMIGFVSKVRANRGAQGFKAGFAIGLLGPVNYLLWKVYNGITDRLGLDTVKNLLVNLALFVALGVVAGRLFNR